MDLVVFFNQLVKLEPAYVAGASFFGFGLVAAWVAIANGTRLVSRARRLAHDGRLEIGEVVHCASKFVTDADTVDHHVISVRYVFTTLAGVRVTGEESITMSPRQFNLTQLPRAGTPVVVLFVDENLYRLL
jgi:hypothetical protein